LEKEMFKEEKKKEREGGRVGGKSHERRKKIKMEGKETESFCLVHTLW